MPPFRPDVCFRAMTGSLVSGPTGQILTQSGKSPSDFLATSPAHLNRYYAKSSALGSPMKRRKFIMLLAGAAATLPLTARAQLAARRPTLGLLIPGSPASYGQRVAALVQQLQNLGWVDGRTITIEYRWAASQRFDEIVAEFVRSKVDVIFTSGTPPTVAAKRVTSEIPIVFAPSGDPLASGLVASLSRPG